MPSPNHVSNLVPITRPTKERKKEEKEKGIEMPPWISIETFESFREMRKKIKKPMTLRAEQLVIKELSKLKEQGFNADDVLEQSIRNDWQDVYPIKNKGNGKEIGVSQQKCKQCGATKVRGFINGICLDCADKRSD
jgi:hypothetical protein